MNFKLKSIIIFLMFSVQVIFCQSIKEELEWELIINNPKEYQIDKKDKAMQLLSIDKFNLIAIDYLVKIYYKMDKKILSKIYLKS